MLDPNKCIETALTRAIEPEPRSNEPREHFIASSIGFCPRKQIAERLRLPPTNPPDTRSRFKMWTGKVVGEALQRELEADGYLDPAWHEKRVDYRTYTGKVDGYTPTIPAIVEIKTADDDAITRYKELPEHYLWQGLFYCVASGVDQLLIFQFGKNQGLVKNRVISLDDTWRKTLNTHMDWIEQLWQEYQQTQQLPEHFHQWGWEDRYCPYVSVEPWEPQEVRTLHESAGT